MINENHLIDVVDKNDKVIGFANKHEKLKKGFISRTVVAFIKDQNNKYIVVKRSPHKKIFPNKWDLAACGNVHHKESYPKAIRREIEEELGIVCNPTLLKKVYLEHFENGIKLKYFVSLFLGQTDREIKLNEELTEYKKIDLEILLLDIKDNPKKYSPFFIKELNLIKDRLV